MKTIAWVVALLAGACSLSTSRPPFPPMPEARVGDLEVEVPVATERLAKALTEAGIPVARVSPQDGYLETPWFDTATGQPAGGRRLGLDVVRVRGWVTPSAHGSSEVKVETVYRPIADPSRPARELERSVPYAHPVRVLVRNAYRTIGARVSMEEPDAITLSARREAARRARAQRDTVPADSVPADSAPVDSLAPPAIAVDDAPPSAADTAAPAAQAAARDTAAAARRMPTPTPPPAQAARDTARAHRAAARDSARAVAPVPAARDTVRAAIPAPAVRDTARPPQPAPRERPRQVSAQQPAPAAGYAVQVAATSDSAAASLAARRLGAMGIEANIVRDAGMLKVRSGVYPSREAAQTVLGRVRRSFPDAFIVR
ncbi:MAG: SPOR domain-containing protein [Gemmatimonadota bacterium]